MNRKAKPAALNEANERDAAASLGEQSKPIGRTSATEREAITSEKFPFWLPEDVIVNPFDIVAVEQVNQPGEPPSRTYGLVTTLEHRTDAPNHLANFISSNFGQLDEEANTNRQGTTVASATVLSNTADIYMPVPSERLIYFAAAEDIQQALGTDALVKERERDAIPAGLIKMSNGAAAVGYLDRRYVLGPESAHVNISGISGLATKTSYAMFLLQSILQTVPDKENIAVIILNVKQADLLQVDVRGPELEPDQKELWEAMGLEPRPFCQVRYLLPRNERGRPNCFSPEPNAYTIYAYDLVGTADKLDLLFSNVADPSGTIEDIYGEIKEILVNNESDAQSMQSWGALLEYLRQSQTGRGRWRNLFVGSSIGMFRRHLRRIVQTRQTGIFVDSRSRNEKLLSDELTNIKGGTTYVDPEETRDLLKQLYQNLMPKKLRHALGEYYTPDWLAERLLTQLGYGGDPSKRLLDPACGSGTFLVLAIKRVHQYADDRMLPPSDVLDRVLENVVGFDLNPLAVISARTNYLLALGDLLPHRQGEISIPVYLADSILTPSMETSESGQLNIPGLRPDEKEARPGYSFNTAVGRFTVPRLLVDALYINPVADLLEESVSTNLTSEQFRARLLHTFPLEAAKDRAEIAVAVALYEQLLELDRKGINGIWARIIKNAFAPLFQGSFDYVAGNPPWVNWESLPEEYRKETVPLWSVHNLFTHKGYEAILGKAKDDISVLLTYVALDDYLKPKGRLGFIITQSVFKTAGAGQGFRRFQLGDGTPVAVVAVDDMADLKPFEGASNRTAIVILERGRAMKYPVPYSYWYKPGGGSVIPEDVTLEDVTREKIATYRQFVAEPIDEADPTSPWITGRPRALKAVKKAFGTSDYQAREGTNTGGANGVYWLEIIGHRPDRLVVINNVTQGAKRKVENVQAAIEPDLLYPLLRGRDVRRWQADSQYHILLTHEQGMGLKAIPEAGMAVHFPKIYAYYYSSTSWRKCCKFKELRQSAKSRQSLKYQWVTEKSAAVVLSKTV